MMSDLAALKSKLEHASTTLPSSHMTEKYRNAANPDISISVDDAVLMQEIQDHGNQAEDWLQYTRTLRNQLPLGNDDNNHNYLCHTYNLAFTSIPPSKQKGMAYAQLLIDCAQIKSDDSPSEAHALLAHARTYARKFAVVHIAAAQFELRQGDEGKCRKILKKAQMFHAEPISLLEKAMTNFENGYLQLLTEEEFGYSLAPCYKSDSERHSSVSSSDSTGELRLHEKPPLPLPVISQSQTTVYSSATEPLDQYRTSFSIPSVCSNEKDAADPRLPNFWSSRSENIDSNVCPLEENVSVCNRETTITDPRLVSFQSMRKENLMLSQSRNDAAAAFAASRIRNSGFGKNQNEADTAPVMRTSRDSEADTAPIIRTKGGNSDAYPPSAPASCSKPFFRSYSSTPNMKQCPSGKSFSCTQDNKKWQSDLNQPRRVIRLCLPELEDEDMEEEEEEALALNEDDDVHAGGHEAQVEGEAMDIDFSNMPTSHVTGYTSGYQSAMTGNSSLNTSHLLAAKTDLTGHNLQQKYHKISGNAGDGNKIKSVFTTSTPAPGLMRTGFDMADSGVISFHDVDGHFKDMITPVPAHPVSSHEASLTVPQLTSALHHNHQPRIPPPYRDTALSKASATSARREARSTAQEVGNRVLIQERKQEPQSEHVLDNRKRVEEQGFLQHDMKRPALSIHESGPQHVRAPNQQLFPNVSVANPVINHQTTPSLPHQQQQQQQPSQPFPPDILSASVPAAVPTNVPAIAPSVVPATVPSALPSIIPSVGLSIAPGVTHAGVPAVVSEPRQPNVNKSKILTVNKKSYSIQKVIGKGGSSKVYAVIAMTDSDNKDNLAIKSVDLSEVDRLVIEGYHNEINLLKRLQYSDKVIRMYDYEHNKAQNKLYIVLERGSTDLASLFRTANKTDDFNPISIKFYWQAMLTAVQVLHKEGIVHSDLKPANFLFVGANLKLIDFGIASAIHQDKTSITMATMIGTLNYMSPEAINDSCGGATYDSNGKTRPKFKINVKSDVWSLGCILYNMVYGKTPFQHIPNQLLKLQAITNPNYELEFPNIPDTNLLDVMKQCLTRDTKVRPSIEELLQHPYLQINKPAPAPAPAADAEVPPMMRDVFSQLSKAMASASPSSIKAFEGFAQRLGQGFGFAAALNTSTKNEGSESLDPKPASVHSVEPVPSQPGIKNIRAPLQNLNLQAVLNGQTAAAKSNKKS